jgi:tetratricopeptide (TPR) repeat protein
LPHIWFGDLLADQKLFDRAIEKYRKAGELGRKKESKDRKSALRAWAGALDAQKLYEQAAEKFREAVSVDPDDPWTYDQFGDMYADQELFDKAIEQYRQADEKWQKKEPKDRKIALRDWARALHNQKHYEQAAEKFREAISVDPDDPWTYEQFGDIYADQKRFDDAIEQYRQADEKWQKKEPKERKIALRDWAYSLRQQKHYEQAVEKYREAIRVDENDPWTYYLR